MALPALALLAATSGGACGGRPAAPPELPKPRTPPLSFDLDGPERTGLDSRSTRGRATAILFGATYDIPTQLEAGELEVLLHRQRPRVNVGLVVLEKPEYAVMAEVFPHSLHLSYPVVLADESTRLGRGPFGAFHRIPTIVVLDREGRVYWRAAGRVQLQEVADALSAASRLSAAP